MYQVYQEMIVLNLSNLNNRRWRDLTILWFYLRVFFVEILIRNNRLKINNRASCCVLSVRACVKLMTVIVREAMNLILNVIVNDGYQSLFVQRRLRCMYTVDLYRGPVCLYGDIRSSSHLSSPSSASKKKKTKKNPAFFPCVCGKWQCMMMMSDVQPVCEIGDDGGHS
jgi:hypothetical protein